MAKNNSSVEAQAKLFKPNPMLKQLEVLVGRWEIESKKYPAFHGREVFEWLEGGAYLARRSEAEPSEFPHAVAIIGSDDSGDTYSMLYYDSRGVSRIYQLSLRDGVWKMWRNATGFSQRFEGTFSQDGRTITAHWEKSFDGSNWEHDFDMIYTKAEG